MAQVATKQKVEAKAKPQSYTELMKSLLKKEAESWYDVSRCAYEIYTRKEWEKLGYASCKEYVLAEFEPYGLTYSTFMYRVKMGEAIEIYDIKKQDVASLGWAKFKEIASYILAFPSDSSTVDSLLKEAGEISSRDLQKKIKELKTTKAGIQREPIHTFTFKLAESQAKIVAQALETAEELCQTDNPSIALAYVCADFLMNHSTDNETINKLRDEIVKAKEEQKKVKIDSPHKYSGRRKKAKEK